LGGKFDTGLIDHGLGILLGEVLEFVVALQSVLHRVGLIPSDVTGDIFALLPGLKFVVRPLLALGHDCQFATFHAFDLSDLLEELGRVHAEISSILDIMSRKI
jgi:hypothetical protein